MPIRIGPSGFNASGVVKGTRVGASPPFHTMSANDRLNLWNQAWLAKKVITASAPNLTNVWTAGLCPSSKTARYSAPLRIRDSWTRSRLPLAASAAPGNRSEFAALGYFYVRLAEFSTHLAATSPP